jgi:hypothetical protein
MEPGDRIAVAGWIRGVWVAVPVDNRGIVGHVAFVEAKTGDPLFATPLREVFHPVGESFSEHGEQR